MGLIEVEKYLTLAPEELSDEEKENLFPEICSLPVENDADAEHLIKLFFLAQELLKFKGEQVESLVTELDNLAAKLGEEEAKRSQNFIDVEDLRSSSTRTDKDGTSSDTDDYHRKLVKMEIQNDRLLSELQEKEQELINEKREIERLSIRISSLEEENKALKSELLSTQQELASNASLKLMTEEQDYPSTEKYHELMELLRQKNKHITQLLSDIEDIEKENNNLKDKLSIVRDELAEGAEQMSKLSMERISLSTNVEELKSKVLQLEQENVGLRSQIAELVLEKENREKQFESINANYEEKLQLLKESMQKKDAELITLRSQLSVSGSIKRVDDSGHLTYLSNLSKTLAEREKQVLELQQQLKQATIDLNESTHLLEEQKKLLQSKLDKNLESNILKQLKKKLEQAENRVMVLEAKAKHAEEDSLKKAEEVTELIIQLREYESGTYGLEEAMLRIKDLQKQKQVRDNQIEQLVQNLNQLQDDANLLEQENQILKERLGISPTEQIVIDDFSRRNLDKQNKISELAEQLEKCNDELLSIKLENRALKKQVNSLQAELNFYRLKESNTDQPDDRFTPDEDKYLESTQLPEPAIKSSTDEAVNIDPKFQEIVDENESLRKGMHEILESIRNHDGSSMIQIGSETLEQLLEALDSRHVNGWYQPGMRLQAHIHQLYGVNKTLREELHICRSREEELHLKLHEASQKIKYLEENTSQNKPTDIIPEHRQLSPKLIKSISCSESLLKSSRELETELKNEKDKSKSLESELEKLRESFSDLEEQFNKMKEQYSIDKESWYNIKVSMQKEIDTIKNNEITSQLKANEYEKSLEILKEEPDEIKKAFVESTFRISSLKVDLQQLTRKYQGLVEMENQARQDKDKLTNKLFYIKQTKDREIVQLRKENEELSNDLRNYIRELEQNVGISEHEKIITDFNQLTVKHRQVLHKQILIGTDKDKLVSKLQQEVASLCSQKLELEVTLKQVFEENRYLRCSTSNISASEQLIALTKQLASVELDVISKRQHSDHMTRMYELIKEQLTETESRCKFLEDQLSEAVEANSELQLNEANLKTKILKFPTESQFEELMTKLKNAENNINTLSVQKKELEEVANIAQEQVQALEQYNRYQDFEYDSLQRRILELQSLSDEKMIIDRLTKELLLAQENGVIANGEIETYKDKVVKLEAEVLQTKIKLSESENEYHKLKKETNNKMRSVYSIIYELQKRYLNSMPLVKEELCFENVLKSKEEHYALTTLILEMRLPTVAISEENESEENLTKTGSREYKSKFKIQDFNLRLINEGLQNKIQIYAERLDRQDKLISRLEQEIMHADEQCQEFLLYWSPHTNIKLSTESDDSVNNKYTQTLEISTSTREQTKFEESSIAYDANDKLDQANSIINELNLRLKNMEDELHKTRDQLTNLMMELKEKELAISAKEEEILNLQKNNYQRENIDELTVGNENDENSIKKLALKTTVDSLQNIINQKEETIKRLQNLLKKNREEHYQTTLELQNELKSCQESADSKETSFNRLKTKLDALEKGPNDKRSFVDCYITKIHKLEDELNEANEKIEQLSSQLATSNQQAELWSHTAEERLKSLQNMKHEMDAKYVNIPSASNTDTGKISYSSLLQIVKEKSEEVERLNQSIEEYKKRLGSGEKLPGYRDRLRNEFERYKRKVELMEQKEKEDKAEIQRLKNQIISRPSSARKKDNLITPKEEQLMKKIKNLEEQIEDYEQKIKKWKEIRRIQCDEEVEKWQNRKRYQHNYEKLRQQFKDQSVQLESIKVNNERLKETIIRLEKERFALESKLKAAKIQNSNLPLIEELQKNNIKLEEEVRILRKTCEMSGSGSLTDVIEAQDRKIVALELAQKGDFALAEEVERLNERKSQLQKYNVHLEKENMRLKLELDELKSRCRITDSSNGSSSKPVASSEIDVQTSIDIKGNKRKNGDLEKAVLVLRRVVEKLQAENKKLHNSKISHLQDKNHVEKLQMDLQNLQENYLDAIEKASALDKELQNANEKIESLQKLIQRLHSGEEISSMKAQLAQKNHLLTKVKVLLEKAAMREKELIEKVNDLQKINPSSLQ